MTSTIESQYPPVRHSRESGNPPQSHRAWIPAFAGMTMMGLLSCLILPSTVHAELRPKEHSWIIWPQGALAFPTGRFGEKDESASAPKDGNKNGYTGGLEAGYFLTEFACIGLNYSKTSFDLDVAQTPGFDHTGSTDVWLLEGWGRFFLTGAYTRWQPYVFTGVGVGQPKGNAKFDPPAFFGAPVNAEVDQLESTVSATSTASAGIGVLIRATSALAFSFEPRFTSVNSKGATRSDLFTQSDGETFEVKSDDQGKRLKAKSNTNWWELRFGVVFLIK